MTNTTIDHTSAKADVKAAKAYAKATRPFYKKKRYWGLVVVAVFGVAALANGGGSDAPTAADSTASHSAPARPDMSVKAGKLIKDFEANELAADAQYKGKTLEVTGVVTKIDTDLLDDSEYILNLTGGGDFEILSVSVHGIDPGELSSVKTGETVTVVGEFDDGGDLGVQLEDGHLVR